MKNQQTRQPSTVDSRVFSPSVLAFKRCAPTVRISDKLPSGIWPTAKTLPGVCRHQLYPTSHNCLLCGKSYLEMKDQGDKFDVEYGYQAAVDGSAGECSVPFPVASALLLGVGVAGVLIASVLVSLAIVYWLVIL